MKVIIYPNNEGEEGNVVVTIPFYNHTTWSEEQAQDKAWEAALLHSSELVWIDDSMLPGDHDCNIECMFFNAWRWDGQTVKTDLAAALKIKWGLIKHAIYQQIDWANGAWDDAEVARLIQIKEGLNADPSQVNAIATIGELETYWPEQLSKRH